MAICPSPVEFVPFVLPEPEAADPPAPMVIEYDVPGLTTNEVP
jgi:hypothetical protein